MLRFAFVVVCALTVPLAAGTLSHENRGADADLTLRRDGDRLVIVDEQARIVAASPAATTDHVVISGGRGEVRDSLTIDFAQPITLARGIDYDGGAGGWDVLALTGGSARRQIVTQLNPHDGIIDVDGLEIRYRNLEPITDTLAATDLTINGTAAFDSVTISDGPGGTTTVSASTFESVTFANKTNVVFDGVSGGDAVNFANPNPATGLVSFIVTNVGSVSQSGDVRYSSLGLSATGRVSLQNLTNDVDRVEITTQNGTANYFDADDLIVGGVSASLAGVRAVQSGSVSVQIINNGTLTLADTDGAEIIKAGDNSGDLVIATQGGDVTATVDRHALVAPAGTLYLQVGRDLILGTAGPNFANDIRVATWAGLNVRRSITIGGLTTVRTDGLPFALPVVAELSVNANDSITQLDGAKFVAAGTNGAEVGLSTLGPISLLGTSPGVESESGNVTLTQQTLIIAPTSGASAPLGRVDIHGYGFDLGGVVDVAGAPTELSDAELDRITAPVVQIINNLDWIPIRVTQPITFTIGTELILHTPYEVTASGAGSLSAPTLTFDINNFDPNTWTITPTSVKIDAGNPVPYTGVTTLNALASVPFPTPEYHSVPDTLFVTPSPTTTINVDGNLPVPPASPGDVLDFNLTGMTNPVLTATFSANGYAGSLTSSNRQPVNFQEIESLVDAPVDLGVTKTDGMTTVPAGAEVAYTITVSNPAPIPVVDATIVDTFPPELIDVAWTCVASSGSSCTSAGNGNLSDTITLAANGSVTYTVTGASSPSEVVGTLTNTAAVTTPAGYTETDSANNSATDTTTLTTEADLLIDKTASASSTFPGGEIAYTITLRNAGPSDAQNVELEDELPAGTTLVSFDAAPGYTCTTGTVSCTRAVLPPSTTADTFTLTVRVNPTLSLGTVITNNVTVTSETTDPSPNNTATAAAAVAPASIPTLSTTMLVMLGAILGFVALRGMRA